MKLETLYKLYNDELHKILRYYSIAEQDINDCANIFYIKADRALKNGKANIIFINGKLNKNYLFTIVKNTALNYKASQWTSTLNIDDFEFEYTEPDRETEREERLKQIINALPNWFDKRIMIIYMTEEMSIRKMAKETGISKTTIFTSLKRSKEFIKRWMK